jgi:pyridoxamine 5'-phosphate oxidase family protein
VSFTEQEVAYLRERPVAHLSTMGADGQPDVVPVALEYDGTSFWVGGGETVVRTRKFRNVAAGRTKVAFVVDDVVSTDPFVPRCLRVYGEASGPVERTGMVGPGHYLRITPTLSWSWNLSGPPSEDWLEPRRAEHTPPP